jgi:hypothetical protein
MNRGRHAEAAAPEFKAFAQGRYKKTTAPALLKQRTRGLFYARCVLPVAFVRSIR